VSTGTEIITVDTPQGPGRFYVSRGEEQRGVLVLGHGAGGGVNAMDLELLARRMPERCARIRSSFARRRHSPGVA